jgi:hypothetical protein
MVTDDLTTKNLIFFTKLMNSSYAIGDFCTSAALAEGLYSENVKSIIAQKYYGKDKDLITAGQKLTESESMIMFTYIGGTEEQRKEKYHHMLDEMREEGRAFLCEIHWMMADTEAVGKTVRKGDESLIVHLQRSCYVYLLVKKYFQQGIDPYWTITQLLSAIHFKFIETLAKGPLHDVASLPCQLFALKREGFQIPNEDLLQSDSIEICSTVVASQSSPKLSRKQFSKKQTFMNPRSESATRFSFSTLRQHGRTKDSGKVRLLEKDSPIVARKEGPTSPIARVESPDNHDTNDDWMQFFGYPFFTGRPMGMKEFFEQEEKIPELTLPEKMPVKTLINLMDGSLDAIDPLVDSDADHEEITSPLLPSHNTTSSQSGNQTELSWKAVTSKRGVTRVSSFKFGAKKISKSLEKSSHEDDSKNSNLL